MFVSKEAINDKDRAVDRAESVVSDVKDGVHRIKKEAHDTARKVRGDIDSAVDVARHAGAEVRSFLNTAGESVSEASDTVAAQIRHNPLPSAAIAMAAGLLIGALFFRRS